jgi:hypothetical protein
MVDSISALMSPATEEEQLKALAEGLRGRKQAADFFALSTIAPLQQMAQGQQTEIQEAAKAQGGLRKALADREQRTADREADRLSREQIAADALAQRTYDADQNRLLRQTLAASSVSPGVGGWGPGYSSKEERTALDTKAKAFHNVATARDTYNTDWTPTVPGITGKAESWVGRNIPAGLVPDSVIPEERQQSFKDKAEFFSTYEQRVNIPYRKGVFGSQFTKPEQKIFERANITENMDPAYVERFLNIRADVAEREAEGAIIDAYMSRDRKGRRLYSKENLSNKFGTDLVERTLKLYESGEYETFRNERIERLNAELDNIEQETQAAVTEEAPAAETGGSKYQNMSLEELQAEMQRRNSM